MTEIETGAKFATLVNTMTTTPEKQQQLLDMLLEATEEHIRHLPGFVSANFHKSADGTRIVNYGHWEKAEDWYAMQADPVASQHIADIKDLLVKAPDYDLYEVVATYSRDDA